MTNKDPRRTLAEKVRAVICEEWAGEGASLESAVVYRRLLREGAKVPDYAMSAVLNAFRVGGLIRVAPREPLEEGVRKHGDLSITGVSPNLCTF
jgi:hypothetical protein